MIAAVVTYFIQVEFSGLSPHPQISGIYVKRNSLIRPDSCPFLVSRFVFSVLIDGFGWVWLWDVFSGRKGG